MPNGVCPQKAHHLGVDEIQRSTQQHGKKRQHPSGHAPLGGMHADLPLQAEALPDHMRGLVENLGQVSAALSLNHDRGDHDAQVLKRNPVQHVVHGGLHFQAIILLLETGSEFAADGIGALARHGSNRGNQAVSGAHGIDHQIQRLRQPLLKDIQALGAFVAHPENGQGACRQPDSHSNEKPSRSADKPNKPGPESKARSRPAGLPDST